jgi:hypothetical protein
MYANITWHISEVLLIISKIETYSSNKSFGISLKSITLRLGGSKILHDF